MLLPRRRRSTPPGAARESASSVVHDGIPSRACWPVRLRRCPRDESRRVHPLARPSRGRNRSSSSSHRSCKHGRCDSVDSRPPMGTGLVARAPGPRSPKTRGEARDRTGGASPRGGASIVATRCIQAGAVRPTTGPLERATVHDRRGPEFHRPHDCSCGRPNPLAPLPAAIDPRVSHRRLLKPSPGHIPRRVGLGHMQPTFFRFSKTCTRWVPHSLPDPRGGRVKPRVTPRWPRFGFERAPVGPWSSPTRPTLVARAGTFSPLTARRPRLPPIGARLRPSELPPSLDGTDSTGPPGSVSCYGGRDRSSDRPSGRSALFEPSARSRRGIERARLRPPAASGRSGFALAQPALPRTGAPSTTMGDALSTSICNERGLRALLRRSSKPDSRRQRLRCRCVPIRGTEVTLVSLAPRSFPGDPSEGFGPLRSSTVRAPRRADCSSLCEAERFHPEGTEQGSTPARLSTSQAPSLERAPQGFCVSKTAVSCSATFERCSIPTAGSVQGKNQCSMRFFYPQHAADFPHVFHNTPQIVGCYPQHAYGGPFDATHQDIGIRCFVCLFVSQLLILKSFGAHRTLS